VHLAQFATQASCHFSELSQTGVAMHQLSILSCANCRCIDD